MSATRRLLFQQQQQQHSTPAGFRPPPLTAAGVVTTDDLSEEKRKKGQGQGQGQDHTGMISAHSVTGTWDPRVGPPLAAAAAGLRALPVRGTHRSVRKQRGCEEEWVDYLQAATSLFLGGPPG